MLRVELLKNVYGFNSDLPHEYAFDDLLFKHIIWFG